MPIEVTMPKLSPTMETGVITQWLVKVGDAIKEGDVLADIETDKATMQMKAYDDGTVVHIDHPAGAEVALGKRVLVLARKNEDPTQVASALGLGNAAPASRPAQAKAGASAPEAAAGPARDLPPAATSEPARPSGNGEQPPDGEGESEGEGEGEPESGARRLKVSPLAQDGIGGERRSGTGPRLRPRRPYRPPRYRGRASRPDAGDPGPRGGESTSGAGGRAAINRGGAESGAPGRGDTYHRAHSSLAHAEDDRPADDASQASCSGDPSDG